MLRNLYSNWKKIPVRIRGTIIISIPIGYLFTSLIAFAWLKSSLVEDEAWVQHTQKVRLETKRLLTALVDAETGVRGYGLTRRDAFLTPYNQARAVIPDSLTKLKNLVQDNIEQTQRLAEIRALVNESIEILQQKLTLQQELKNLEGREELVVSTIVLYDWLEEGKAAMDATRAKIDQFATEEERLLKERKQHQELYRQITWIAICLSAIIGTIGGLLAFHLFYQLETELNERESSLRQSNQQLQRFTANASHELRAPLAAILSNAQLGLMLVEEEPDQAKQRLEKIVGLTKSIGNLVNELLFLARHEGLIASEFIKPIDLVSLLKNLTPDWQERAESQKIAFQTQLPIESIIVKADADLLRLAVVNLLSNACRYTNAGGKVWLRLFKKSDRAIIQVEDTGIGIPSDALSHIFERFYRVDQTRRKFQGGFGLGLAIAQQIMQAHNGEITVSSKLGVGSIFQLSLPLEIANHQTAFVPVDGKSK